MYIFTLCFFFSPNWKHIYERVCFHLFKEIRWTAMTWANSWSWWIWTGREVWPSIVMLSLAGDLAVAWHLADPAVPLRDYRPPRVSVMWSRLSPTHSWWPQTLTSCCPTLTKQWKEFCLKCVHILSIKPSAVEFRGVCLRQGVWIFLWGSFGISWKFASGRLSIDM